MKSVGFIGIGKMGHWMVKNLMKANEKIYIFDSNPDMLTSFESSNVIIANDLNEIAENCNHIILMLPNSQIIEKVVKGEDGLANHMNPGDVLIDMSSSYPLSTQEMEAFLDERDVKFFDAPVSGGVKKAKDGSLTIMVGGDESYFESLKNLLSPIGSNIKYVGKVGAGHSVKAINNYLSASSMYATAEAMMLAQKMGVKLDVALDTINESSGKSHSTSFKYPTYVLPKTFNSNFSLALHLKDIKITRDLASDLNMPMLLGSSLVEVYEAANNLGGGNQDHTEIIKYLEKIAGEELNEY